MKKNYSSIVSLLSMVLVVGIAYELDIWLDKFQQIARSNFTVLSHWLLPAMLVELLFTVLLFTWLWYVTNKASNHPVVNIIFILVGLGLLFYNYLASVFGISLPLLLPFIPKSLSSFASAFVAVVGLQRLVFKKKEIDQ